MEMKEMAVGQRMEREMGAPTRFTDSSELCMSPDDDDGMTERMGTLYILLQFLYECSSGCDYILSCTICLPSSHHSSRCFRCLRSFLGRIPIRCELLLPLRLFHLGQFASLLSKIRSSHCEHFGIELIALLKKSPDISSSSSLLSLTSLYGIDRCFRSALH
ncbi:hypothetical protein PMAYCL1PPCAC_29120 [Pristionchus mayeri]|uniref:Uncharacterized protein n=1 Tax=Pristionchus mayeri TaxID=1317129 RepID=A0AAN5DA80_9BILA|nr:hypothetical protein PMAYCL1PPCAC_29120 [Pristionchus mayeri]